MKSRICALFSLVILILSSAAWLGCVQEVKQPASDGVSFVTDSVAAGDGAMVYYDVYGDQDRTIAFIHCWSCDRSYWKNQIDALTPYFRVVTIDLAGHGQSGLGREDWTIESFGADVASVLNKEGISEVILVGHSMGGPVAIEAARRMPAPVTAVIGVDNFQNFANVITEEQIAGLVSAFEADFTASTDRFVRGMFPTGADSAIAAWVAEDMASAPPEIAIDAIRSTLGYDYRVALAEMRRPIRTISSDGYPTSVETNREIASSFEVKLMPGTGHFPHLLEPETFNRLLLETIGEFWPDAEYTDSAAGL